MKHPQLTQRNEIFNQQIESDIVRSRYDLTERHDGSYRMGVLYPIYCRNDILPGDRFSISCAPFIRFLPMVSPSLTNVEVEVRYFFVPYRILWDKWKNFISPSKPEDVNLIEPGLMNFAHVTEDAWRFFNVAGSLYDYLGCASLNWSTEGGYYGVQDWWSTYPELQRIGGSAPTKNFGSEWIPDPPDGGKDWVPLVYSAYPFAAYNMIWNNYFRDENLQLEAVDKLNTGQGYNDNHPYDFFLRRVNWTKDYFSSALPFVTQAIMGAPNVVDGMTIEGLREASALTRWLEKQTIGGHRYQESIMTHFGIHVPDEAAQMPIYLGGGKCPIQIGSVEQNSPLVDGSTPLATLGGRATASDSFHVDKCEFKEHGVILGLMYIRPVALYADVTARDLFVRLSRHDHYWPDFANLGDEAICADELNPGFFGYRGSYGGQGTDFGYQMRYASYRTSFDHVHGLLRPTNNLDSWTQARTWSEYSEEGMAQMVEPFSVSDSFITCKPSNRIFADTTDVDNLVGEVTTFVDAERPMPSYIDPKID